VESFIVNISLLKELRVVGAAGAINISLLTERNPFLVSWAKPRALSFHPHLINQHTSPALIHLNARIPQQSRLSR